MKTTTSVFLSAINDDDDIYTLVLFHRKSDCLKLAIAIDNALIVHWSHICILNFFLPLTKSLTFSTQINFLFHSKPEVVQF